MPSPTSPTGGAATVPWVALWEGESRLEPVRCDPESGFLRYTREERTDRDEHGVLWMRHIGRRGHGRPLFSQTHSRRQRQCMRSSLCQICGERIEPDGGRLPWLLPAREYGSRPKRLHTTGTPPTCRPCWTTAVEHCPHLRVEGAVALMVGEVVRWGVAGLLHTPGVSLQWTTCGYDESAPDLLGRVLAETQLVVLHDVREVPLPD
ncbi:hypothetical protein O7627_15085 [Solwaraspora sp. WMMD1047]|uniref:hypothetical protein n=1 Tax=Solwaraspora sp. WMMD1047 TaxID=3016102 RepID=UPI002415A2A3|nr:hypothetical protein [Solwaraspora sp. WMMD1047]MDG4830616.1 hypothetical protein [Solwaraspora sp. WMMD1047]